jgi:hypothetical protein
MLVGFGDESGTPHPASEERFFIVALPLEVSRKRREMSFLTVWRL